MANIGFILLIFHVSGTLNVLGQRYLGCYTTMRNVTDTTERADMTPDTCITFCQNTGDNITIAAVRAGSQCSCSNAKPIGLSNTCQMQCSGNTSLICGGQGAYNTYSMEAPSPSADFYMGCHKDFDGDHRDLNGSQYTFEKNLTVQLCLATCTKEGYHYAGLRRELCNCGNRFGRHNNDRSKGCNTQCNGDGSQNCGGKVHNAIYRTQVQCSHSTYKTQCLQNRSDCENKNACQPCSQHCDDVCDRATGVCLHCKNGWAGPRCNQPCPSGTWGTNCSQTNCSTGCENQCSPINGTCDCVTGWKGILCDSCVPSKWGENCNQTCSTGCKDNSCDQINGTCSCVAGWQGKRCDSPCGPAKWGENCSQSCPAQCRNQENSDCNGVNGRCTRCIAGWTGNDCNTPVADTSKGVTTRPGAGSEDGTTRPEAVTTRPQAGTTRPQAETGRPERPGNLGFERSDEKAEEVASPSIDYVGVIVPAVATVALIIVGAILGAVYLKSKRRRQRKAREDATTEPTIPEGSEIPKRGKSAQNVDDVSSDDTSVLSADPQTSISFQA